MKMESDKEELECKERRGNVMEERQPSCQWSLVLWSMLTQHGCRSHTQGYTHIHTHGFIPPADCLILTPQGGVSLEESEGLPLDTKVRGVIILSLFLSPPWQSTQTHPPSQNTHTHTHFHTHTHTHTKPPIGSSDCNTQYSTGECVTATVVIMVVSSRIRSSSNPLCS